MLINDINFQDEIYDAQRGIDIRKCIKIWDYDALWSDLKKCDDITEPSAMMSIMQKGRGSLNPKEISNRLKQL